MINSSLLQAYLRKEINEVKENSVGKLNSSLVILAGFSEDVLRDLPFERLFSFSNPEFKREVQHELKFIKDLHRCCVIMPLSWSCVKLLGNPIAFSLSERSHATFFRKILTNQTIAIFI